jgi:hypothetical protein
MSLLFFAEHSMREGRMAKRGAASKVRTVTIDVASKTKTPSTIGDRRVITPAFANYVTRNEEFLVHVRDMRDQIENYITKGTSKRPLNILLAAPPGSGKSFLIKQMMSSITAKNSAVQISFEEIYVAALENVDELFKTFQRVQSINLEGKIPIVFYDEIDALIAHSSPLYPKFLAPMWDGTFYLGKDKFYLGQCIFFFAGSGLSLEDASRKILKFSKKGRPLSYDDYYTAWKKKFDNHHAGKQFVEQKLPDFLDRIDSVLRIPPVCEELLGRKRASEEYDDLACMLIRKHFPNVRFVEKEALKIIRDALKDQSSMRMAEKIVFNSKSKPEEDYELLDISCLPRRNRKIDVQKKQEWWEIVFEPPRF